MTAFPPHRSSITIPIPASTAHTYLTSYLSACTSSPYLLTNARLEATGPIAGSSQTSVTMHNLRRVEAGLRGEWLASSSVELKDGGGIVKVTRGMDDGTHEGSFGEVQGNGEGQFGKEEGEGEWQDLELYQREQSMEGVDLAAQEGMASGTVVGQGDLERVPVLEGGDGGGRKGKKEKKRWREVEEEEARRLEEKRVRKAKKKARKEAKASQMEVEEHIAVEDSELA